MLFIFPTQIMGWYLIFNLGTNSDQIHKDYRIYKWQNEYSSNLSFLWDCKLLFQCTFGCDVLDPTASACTNFGLTTFSYGTFVCITFGYKTFVCITLSYHTFVCTMGIRFPDLRITKQRKRRFAYPDCFDIRILKHL